MKGQRAQRATPENSLRFYLGMRTASLTGTQMFNVAFGWQIYELTNSALILGIAGLIRFAPAVLLFPVAGYVADRFSRLVVLRLSCLAQLTIMSVYFANSLANTPNVVLMLAMLGPFGASRAFFNTAMRAIIPGIAHRSYLSSAIAYASSTSKLAAIAGPLIGGVAVGIVGGDVYLVVGAAYGISLMAMLGIHSVDAANGASENLLASLFGGIAFLLRERSLLSAILLDFTTVLWGTVIGLLPVFAKDVLDAGPEGLGLLRAMPALGSVLAAIFLGRLSAPTAIGPTLFSCLLLHCATIIGFGVSSSLWLSIGILVAYGCTDMVCVILRQSLLQLSTPNKMLGRVAAIETAGSNGSEELGNFRSGVMAAALGPQAAVVFGGLIAATITLLWLIGSPGLRRTKYPS